MCKYMIDNYSPDDRAAYNKSYFEENKDTINEQRKENRREYMQRYRLFRTLKKSLLKRKRSKPIK